MRLGAITHQSLGQDPLKDTSCLNGKEKEGAVAGFGGGGGGVQLTAPNPPFTLLQWSGGLAARGILLKYISLFHACLNETSGLKNHTVCGSINTSSPPTMATQQVSVTKHSLPPPQFLVSLNRLFKKPCFIYSQRTHITQIHAHHCSLIRTCRWGRGGGQISMLFPTSYIA